MDHDQDIITKLEKLAKLYNEGNLTEEEFSLAKKKLLNDGNASSSNEVNRKLNIPPNASKSLPKEFQKFAQDDDLGRAANRYVSLQVVMSIIGVIIFCIFGMVMCSQNEEFDRRFNSFPNINNYR